MQEIKEFRKKQGWTQKQIAEYLEIPTITYVQWENGTRNAPQYVLNLIKYKLRTDTNQISLELTGRTFNVIEKKLSKGSFFNIYEENSISFNADKNFWENEEKKGGKYPPKIKTFKVKEIL